MASDQPLLKRTVIEHSMADTWEEAKKEWDLLTIFTEESNCICNHFIMDNCEIRNERNGNTLIVGNVCIHHFEEPKLNVPEKCFEQLKTIQQDPTKFVGVELLRLADGHSIWSARTSQTYRNIVWGDKEEELTNRNKRRRSSLSGPQSKLIEKLNRLLLLGCSKERPKCPQHNCYMQPKQNSKDHNFFWGCPKYFTKECKQTRPVD